MKRVYQRIALVMSLVLILTSVCTTQSQAKKKKIRLNKKKATLYLDSKPKVKLKVKGTKKKVTWKSLKKKVAKVSKKGVVTGISEGTAKITAKVKKQKKKLVCVVTVKASKKTTAPKKSPSQNGAGKTPAAGASSNPSSNPSAQPSASSSSDVPVSSVEPGVSQEPAVSTEPTPERSPRPTPVAEPVDETLSFSKAGGFYGEAFDLALTAKEGYTIYYTLDGSVPDINSTKYTAPIHVKDRSGDSNVLASEENVKKMCITDNGQYSYVPTANEVAKCTVVRAVAIGPDGTAGNVLTRSYFVGGKSLTERYPGAAVLSIVTDPDNLLNYETGIHALGKIYDEWKNTDEGKQIRQFRRYWNYVGNYTQKGKAWERPVSLELFDGTNTKTLTSDAGIRLHGGASRMYGQKSFNIYFRKDYTPKQKNLKYELLPEATDPEGVPIYTWKSFILRNGGNDAEYTKFHCAFVQSLVRDRAFLTQASRPAVMFLNGEYWGVYNLTEKYSDKTLEEHYGVDSNNVVVIKEGELEEGDEKKGDMALYEDLLSYADKDMSNEAVYQEFCSKVDIRSMLDYYATEIYIANNDWPEKNYQLWRTREPEEGNEYGDCKWRYMLFDTEYSMGLYGGGGTGASFDSFKEAVSSADADPVFASVVKNAGFREEFLKTLKEIGGTNFKYETAKKRLEEFRTQYEPLIDEHYTRFGYGNNKSWLFDSQIDTIDDFLQNRYDSIIKKVEKDLKAY